MMKKLKSIMLCMLVIGCISLLTLGVSAIMASQDAEMAENLVTTYELDTQEGKKVLYVNYGASGCQFEIADDLAVTYGDGQSAQAQLYGYNETTYAYVLDVSADEDEITVTPPTLYFYRDVAPVTISSLAENTQVKYSGSNWFTITGIEQAETDGGVLLTVSIEANGNRHIVPRYPTLTIDGTEYGATAIIDFDEDSNFVSGAFQYTLSEVPADLSGASISIENTLEKSLYTQDDVCVSEAHTVQTTTNISEYLD